MDLYWDEKTHQFVNKGISSSYMNSEETEPDKPYRSNSEVDFPALENRELANKNYVPPEFNKKEFPKFDNSEQEE